MSLPVTINLPHQVAAISHVLDLSSTGSIGRHELRIKDPEGHYRHVDVRETQAFPLRNFDYSCSYGLTPVAFSDEWGVNKDGKPTPFAMADRAVSTQCLWADIDGGMDGIRGARELLVAGVKNSGIPRPSSVIVTGGGIHCLWRLSDPVDLTDEGMRLLTVNTLKRITLAIGGKRTADRAIDSRNAFADDGAAKLTFAVRLPGSWNPKYHLPREVAEIPLTGSTELWSLTHWRAFLPELPIRYEKAITRTNPDTGVLPRWVIEWMMEGAPSGSRHTEAVRVGGKLARYGYSEDVIQGVIEEFAAASGWNTQKGEIEKIVRWAVAK